MEPVRFNPPLYEQRYEFVKSYIDTHKPKKVADLGCSECSLLHMLKFRRCIEELVGVDIDEDILKRKGYTLSPLPIHYLDPLDRPLTVALYHGSVCEKDPALLGLDLITCIELIEHLVSEDLQKFQEVLFGFMAPSAVVISTPNVEFNVLLSADKPRFRHPDHKFEWNRKEFQTWAMNMSRKHNYTVEFTGVGEAGPESKDVGYCSQIGIFTKNYTETEESIRDKKNHKSVYKRVLHVVYPSIQDEKYLRKVVLNLALSRAECIKANFLRNLFPEEEEEEESDMADSKDKPPILARWLPRLQTSMESKDRPPFLEGGAVHVPIETLFAIPKVKELCGSLDVLRNMMNGEMTLSADGSAIVYPLRGENDLDSDMSDD